MNVEIEPIKPDEAFLDDAPVSEADWNTLPARHWRDQPTKFTCAETAKMGIIGFGMFIMALTLLVLAFCYF